MHRDRRRVELDESAALFWKSLPFGVLIRDGGDWTRFCQIRADAPGTGLAFAG